ncbi:hypothetical protein PAECIP111893_02553 [Paenibacillus plantiphilus]|uniref:Uncharacterized protein n=1 Tax=Paenibacillus plantiphilus TaxID=2905650 RepID=A0ABN8GGE2_9BACL|nr:hypothetical protein PAECIP111893_02553 [Paenibacillus plantiphilus]
MDCLGEMNPYGFARADGVDEMASKKDFKWRSTASETTAGIYFGE